MSLYSRFKKDYINYLISIVLPALISGLSIPVFKYLLGSEKYGKYALWINAILLSTSIFSGWIAQSIVRFYPAYNDKTFFIRKSLSITLLMTGIFFIPAILIAWFVSGSILLSFFSGLLLAAIIIQFILLSVVQSAFLSKKIIFSESIRVLVFMSVSVLLLLLSGFDYLFALVFATLVGYVSSSLYLFSQLKKAIANNHHHAEKDSFDNMISSFLKYGLPLSFWFVFAYLFTYVDKIFILQQKGAEAQGNYQAIFDLLSRSITIIISPALTSVYPLLASAYEKGEHSEISKLLRKIISFQILGGTITLILYWFIGADIISFILNTPDNLSYKWMGMIVIAASFIWQVGIVFQKKYELQKKSFFLLKTVAFSFVCQLLFYFLNSDSISPIVYPAGFLVACSVYLFLILFFHFNIKSKISAI